MANVLILDATGSAVDFAMRCMKAGHHVRTCMSKDKHTGMRRPMGDGLIEKIERDEWDRSKTWADIILTTDNVRYLRELDLLKKRGFPVFAPSYESAELELNREKGQKLLEKCGIKIMPYESFSDYGKAEKYVMSTMERYVSKPNGDRDKSFSYVSKSARDMVYMLHRWKEKNKGVPPQFMLQEFVPGVEFSVNGWMGSQGFASYVECEVEYKKLLSGNYGPNTGQTGAVIKYTDNSPLAEKLLYPVEQALMKLGHTGSVDISAIIDEEGEPRPLEFTSRPGWPSFNIVQCLHDEPVQWMIDLLDGHDTFRPSEQIAVGLVMAIPNFPYDNAEKKDVTGIPLYNVDDDNPYRDQIAVCEVMSGTAPDDVDGFIVDKRMFVSCGDYLAVATGLGDTVREAAKQAYEVAASVEIPCNMILRDDIGENLKKNLPILQDAGFALDWEY